MLGKATWVMSLAECSLASVFTATWPGASGGVSPAIAVTGTSGGGLIARCSLTSVIVSSGIVRLSMLIGDDAEEDAISWRLKGEPGGGSTDVRSMVCCSGDAAFPNMRLRIADAFSIKNASGDCEAREPALDGARQLSLGAGCPVATVSVALTLKSERLGLFVDCDVVDRCDTCRADASGWPDSGRGYTVRETATGRPPST